MNNKFIFTNNFSIIKKIKKKRKSRVLENPKIEIKYIIKKQVFKILLILINIYSILNYKIKNSIQYRRNQNIFIDILPKINLKTNYIPSLEEIFNSRKLYIFDSNLTGEYIRYLRPIKENEEKNFKKKYFEFETIISPEIFKKREDQYNYLDFAKFCLEEKLIYSNKIEYDNRPLISIILPSYNKKNILMKSIRSIQNQSFKNIEIIIVNDCSTDQSNVLLNDLLKNDPRIRIFNHMKNMGLWRSRLDGILYSKAKYILLFDTGDLYEDNYVLEDAYNLMEKYNLDSLKMIFRIIRSFDKLNESKIFFHVYNDSKIIYKPSNIENFNNYIFKGWGNIWNRIVRAKIYIKGLYLLNDIVLNIYKNVWDDVWYNTIINKVSYSFLIIERVGYIYIQDGNGEGSPKSETETQKDKIIKEYLGFYILIIICYL